MFLFSGMVSALVGLGGYAARVVRDVEIILPDHDTLPAAMPAALGSREAA